MAEILVVDDTPEIRALAAHFLEKCGHTVRRVASADEAVPELLAHPAHLVLLDLDMPNKDGIECLEMIRATPGVRTTPVLVATATPWPEALRRAEELGVIGVVVKHGQWLHHVLPHIERISRGGGAMKGNPGS